MPSKSGPQHRIMAASCTDAKVRKKTGISKKVACDFMHADKGKHFKEALDKLAETMIKEAELDKHSRWVLDSGMNTTMEGEDPFASWQGMDSSRKHYDSQSMRIIDGAIRVTAAATTAADRQAALEKYADEVGVPFAILYAEIIKDTSTGYFNTDDYTKGHEFQRPTRESKIMDSYKAAIKKN